MKGVAMSGKGLAIGLCLFVVMAGRLLAQENDFTISKNLPNYNRYPKLSINADGRVFVAWYNSPTWGVFRAPIHTSLCIPRKDGSYKVTKPRQITITGRLIMPFDMANNPEDDSWIIAWWEPGDTSQTEENYEVMTRKFDAKGRASGSQHNITDNLDKNDRQPVVAYLPSSGNSPAVSKGGYMMAWDSHFITNVTQSGIFSVHLNEKGLPIAGTSRVVRKAHVVNGSVAPSELEEMIRTTDGKYVLAVKDWFSKKGTKGAYYPLLLRMDSSGVSDAKLLPDSPEPINIRVNQITPKKLLAAWITNDDTRICLVNTKTFKNTKVQTYVGNPFENSGTLAIVKLENDPGSLLLLKGGWGMYGEYYDQNGKPTQEPQLLFSAGGPIDYFDAACIPGSNNVFIVYGLSKGTSVEIRGRVIGVVE
jgi:hypothetical protein